MTTATIITATTSNILGANGSPGYSCTATLDWRLGCVQRTELPNLPNLPDLSTKLTWLAYEVNTTCLSSTPSMVVSLLWIAVYGACREQSRFNLTIRQRLHWDFGSSSCLNRPGYLSLRFIRSDDYSVYILPVVHDFMFSNGTLPIAFLSYI